MTTVWNPRLFSEAHERLKTAPATLSSADLEQLAIFSPDLARQATELREKALHPAPAPVPRQAPAARLDVDELAAGIVGAMAEAIAPLAARIKALESRPEVQYRGTFEEGQAYGPGCLVTKQGSLWLCLAATTAAPGTDHPSWRLIVKQGKV